MNIHTLEIDTDSFNAIINGSKNVEIISKDKFNEHNINNHDFIKFTKNNYSEYVHLQIVRLSHHKNLVNGLKKATLQNVAPHVKSMEETKQLYNHLNKEVVNLYFINELIKF